MTTPQPRCGDRLTSATDMFIALGRQTRHVPAKEMPTSSDLAGFSFALSAKLHLPENCPVSLPNSSRRSRAERTPGWAQELQRERPCRTKQEANGAVAARVTKFDRLMKTAFTGQVFSFHIASQQKAKGQEKSSN